MCWKTEMIWATILFRIAECGEKIPLITDETQYQFIDEDLTGLHAKGYLEINDTNDAYIIGKKGKDLLARFVGMFDQAMRFEIFANVDITTELPEDIVTEDGDIMDHCFDPRFDPSQGASEVEDLRIAMFEYAVEAARREGNDLEFDPRRIVFLQLLADGKLTKGTQPFWFDIKLGEAFNEIQSIVDNAYRWQDLSGVEGPQGLKDSWEIASSVYAAGMLEQRKREGATCSNCGIPLAIFESHAKTDSESLDECPNPDCGADFRDLHSGQAAEYECPSCGADIYKEQSTCTRCGAHVDFSLPTGTVVETVTETSETVTEDVDECYRGYGYCYGYQPYGWYDPWYPATDAFALGLVCGALIL